MPDYAEVMGCSTFKKPVSPQEQLDSHGAYATTNLVRNATAYHASILRGKSRTNYSTPAINHLNANGDCDFSARSESNLPAAPKAKPRMNIIENKFELINGINRPSSPSPSRSSARRNVAPKIEHSDKIKFGGPIDQPLFVKSREDGSWTSVQNLSYHAPSERLRIDSKLRKVTNSNNFKSNENVGGDAANSATAQLYLPNHKAGDDV